MATIEKSPLWSPSENDVTNCITTKFMSTINHKFNIQLNSYDQLYNWSVDNFEEFWKEFLFFSDIKLHDKYSIVLEPYNSMADIPRWFVGSTLNFTENVLRYKDDRVAFIQLSENYFLQQNGVSSNEFLSNATTITYRQLYNDTVKLALSLTGLGIKKGDVIVGLVSNSIFAVKSALACAFIGGIWTCVSPDSQATAIIMRIGQTNPKVLMATPYVTYNNKLFSQFEKFQHVLTDVPSIKTIISDLPLKKAPMPKVPTDILAKIYFVDEFIDKYSQQQTKGNAANIIDYFPFEHPLYIMYSSGTTGIPKGIVHSAGSAWMMWNWVVSALFTGCTIILFDGSPFYPNANVFLDILERFNVTVWGCGAAYFQMIESKNLNINMAGKYSFEKLKCVLSTGSVLPSHTFEYITDCIKNVQIGSISGGTDIISCFVGNNPLVPVYSGETQRRNLGMAVNVYCEDINCNQNHFDMSGELVCVKPFPSMPIYLIGDTSQRSKYLETYFSKYPGVWHQGDFCEINSSTQGVVIHGRSDATLNPNGVRFGSSEIYNILNHVDEIMDSLVVGQQIIEETEKCILFVKCSSLYKFDEEMEEKIKKIIRTHLSPRHTPFKILSVPDIPYTVGGKKVELLIKKLISRKISLEEAFKYGFNTLRNPDCIKDYYNFLIDGIL